MTRFGIGDLVEIVWAKTKFEGSIIGVGKNNDWVVLFATPFGLQKKTFDGEEMTRLADAEAQVRLQP